MPESPLTAERKRIIEDAVSTGRMTQNEGERAVAALEAQSPEPRLNALAWGDTPVKQHVRDGRVVRAHTRRELRVLAEDFLEGRLNLQEYLNMRTALGPFEVPSARKLPTRDLRQWPPEVTT